MTALAPTGHRVCGVAREHGPVRALAALYDGTGVDVLHCGPGGHALAPLAVAHDATRLCLAGTVVDRDTAAETVLTPSALDGLDLIAIRARATLGGPPRMCRRWALALAWLRLGLAQSLLSTCLGYLRARTVAGTPLVNQQLVKGTLADAVVEHSIVETVLAGADPDGLSGRALTDLHHQLTAADRMLLRLLGASGFVAAGPATVSYVSELFADVYVRGTDDGPAG